VKRPAMRAAVAALALAGGVAAAQQAAPANPADPFEGFNRGVMAFNDGVDNAVLKPLAEGWRNVAPQFVRTGVTNFFNNLGDGWSAVNHLLQGKLEPAANMTLRLAVNSVFGIGGLLDIATEAGLERQPEDFGQTLGVWGLPPGPYLVLPLLGPSTVRDTGGLVLDYAPFASLEYTEHRQTLNSAFALNLVNTRTNLLGASRLLDDVALDRYSFLRDAYLARRRNLVHDGNPPEERFDDEEPAPK
jgi:phospholipid-binding lipoprotein MlaA